MECVYPHALWLLLLLPVLGWWHLRRPRAALAFADLRLVSGTATARAWRLLGIPLLLRLLLVSAVIVGLARPRWPDETARIPAQSTAIVLVLDVSGSMAEEDLQRQGKPVSRLDAAKDVIRQFIRGDGQGLSGRGEDLIGLVKFAARVEEDVCPPTLSHQSVLRLVDAAKPQGQVLENTTNIGDALAVAINLLQRSRPQAKTIILLTDGEHNVPPEVVPGAITPRQAAHLARPLGIKIHTIFLAGASSTPAVAQEQKKAAAALQDVADLTGGKAYQASDAEALRKVYAELDAQERTWIESHQYYRYRELYPWCGMIALLALLGMIVGEETRWRQLP
jgi:Ca-activated chloride channel family protein